MSRHKKFQSRYTTAPPKTVPADTASREETLRLANREKYIELFLPIALLAFGIYQSILYFGHKIIPNPDFVSFAQLGHELLSLKIPSSFMRAPVLGLLQASLSYIVGGQHPDLTAGWLLNAILHPFNLLLLYLVGKRIVGRSALWFAIIAILNPWVIYMLTEPIVETTLLFFTLLTFYFLLKHSKWSYLFASMAMMVRYEGAALIMAAFVMDLIHSTNRRQRILAFFYSALASLPLVLWLLGTVLTWKAQTGNYFDVFTKQYAEAFAQPVKERTGVFLHMEILWTVGFQPLFMLPTAAKTLFTNLTSAEVQSIQTFFGASKVIALAGFAFGCIYGLYKRQWHILALLIFFVPYFLLHSRYPYPFQRFHTIIFWIVMLICLFGLQSVWRLVDRNGRTPLAMVYILQLLVLVISAVWFISLVVYLPRTSAISPRSAWLPYVAMFLAAAIFAGQLYVHPVRKKSHSPLEVSLSSNGVHKARKFLPQLTILVFVCLVIVSNQFTLARLIGDGQQDKEFALLADWFAANAKQGEKMGVYMAPIVKIFAPKLAEDIVALPKADSPDEFIKACSDQNITYVVWATREGLRDHTGYRQLGLHKNIAQLAKPKSTGPYQFVTQIGSERGYVNIFRLSLPR